MILVGAAIAFVHHSKKSSIYQLVVALVGLAAGLVAIVLSTAAKRARDAGSRLPGPPGLSAFFEDWTVRWAGWLVALEAVLVLTGLAAGVK